MFESWKSLSLNVKQYLVVTCNYWVFTLTDGALRMLVVLYFYQQGYQPLTIAMLFVFYEVFGVVTNLIGGWLGARIGLNNTMNIGLILQVFALLMLAVPSDMLSVLWVMAAQALSGIAKDLNKMSAKSSIKSLVNDEPINQQSPLFRWVALLTGSKNALKGIGFFIGGILLSSFGFQKAMLIMSTLLFVTVIFSLRFLNKELGKAKNKPKFSEILSKDASLNYLSAARLCLFAARDVWFVIALPVFLMVTLKWQHETVGVFLACWIIGYGFIQANTPNILKLLKNTDISGRLLSQWATLLAVVTGMIALFVYVNFAIEAVIVVGLLVFGAVFAINSSLHSYVIVSMAKEEGVSTDVGFYYMANALGRLLGTVLSGWIFQQYGLILCLVISMLLAACSAFFIRKI
ncbi:organoarsenical effux MFS transporter ArsJ [Colwelliaceae bacterium 6441]